MNTAPLTQMIHRLWTAAGRPPSRAIARRTGNLITHTTVSTVISGKKMARWSSVVHVVQALGGNPDEFRVAWEREWDAHETARHIKAGRSRVRVARGVTARPGDTLVFTVPEAQDPIELELAQQYLKDLFPDNPVHLVAGAQVTVIRREEVAA